LKATWKAPSFVVPPWGTLELYDQKTLQFDLTALRNLVGLGATRLTLSRHGRRRPFAHRCIAGAANIDRPALPVSEFGLSAADYGVYRCGGMAIA